MPGQVTLGKLPCTILHFSHPQLLCMAIVRTNCVNLSKMMDTMRGTQNVILDTFVAGVALAIAVVITSFIAIAVAAVVGT